MVGRTIMVVEMVNTTENKWVDDTTATRRRRRTEPGGKV